MQVFVAQEFAGAPPKSSIQKDYGKVVQHNDLDDDLSISKVTTGAEPIRSAGERHSRSQSKQAGRRYAYLSSVTVQNDTRQGSGRYDFGWKRGRCRNRVPGARKSRRVSRALRSSPRVPVK